MKRKLKVKRRRKKRKMIVILSLTRMEILRYLPVQVNNSSIKTLYRHHHQIKKMKIILPLHNKNKIYFNY